MVRKLGGLILLAASCSATAATQCNQPQWKVESKVDPMKDGSSCLIRAAGVANGSLVASVRGGEVTFIVAGNDHPLHAAGIRVDDRPAHYVRSLRDPLSTSTFKPDGRNLLDEIQSGTQVKTQSWSWPEGVRKDLETPICELPSLIQQCIDEQTARR